MIPAGGDPTKVPLNDVEFWIQIYDLPSSYMTESIGKQLKIFFGSYVIYDMSIWREFMCLKSM